MLKFWYVLMSASLNGDPCNGQQRDVQEADNTKTQKKPMLATSRFTASAAAWLLCAVCLVSHGVQAQGSADSIGQELAALRAEKSQLEREVAQYRASIDLLRANGAGGVDSPALQALAEELGRTRGQLRELGEREQALAMELSSGSASAAPGNTEVSRLTSLLQGYYADVERESPADATGGIAAEQLLAQTDLDSGKVLLSGTEGIAAINLISERLAATGTGAASRQRNIVFNVEIRRAGELVSKTNHSLRPVGESQYVTKVSLGGGDARISVRSEQWRVQLENAGEYLLTLYSPTPGETQLYVIPVDALRATRWNDTPNWLPPLGNTASRS